MYIQYVNVIITADDPNAVIKRHYVDDPLKRSTKLKDLEPNTEYLLFIWARTNAGAGDQDYLEDKTIVVGRKYSVLLTFSGNTTVMCMLRQFS